MKIYKDQTELPVKILSNLSSIKEGAFRAGIKTSFKPNSTIPILWLILHSEGVMFCCTHRTRGIYEQFLKTEVNSIKVSQRSLRLEFLLEDITKNDFIVDMPNNTDFEELKSILILNGYEVG
ncbi:MAG: hypothetical protein HRU20_07720 [Pseudomonadales bacterium]|nr:hypothetical protein [Pseudomonadales bacterium]